MVDEYHYDTLECAYKTFDDFLNDRPYYRNKKSFLSDKAKDWLAENGYDEHFGARPLKRLIQQEVENPLAIKLLNGDIKDNSTVFISADKNGLVI